MNEEMNDVAGCLILELLGLLTFPVCSKPGRQPLLCHRHSLAATWWPCATSEVPGAANVGLQWLVWNTMQ